MKSVFQQEKECWVCKKPYGLESHHIFHGDANRKISERLGYKVWLCPYHHRDGKVGVHFCKEADEALMRMAQSHYEQTHTREEFIRLIGRNYL